MSLYRIGPFCRDFKQTLHFLHTTFQTGSGLGVRVSVRVSVRLRVRLRVMLRVSSPSPPCDLAAP